MLPEGLILVSRTAFKVGDMRSLTMSTFWFPFPLLGKFLGKCASPHTQHILVFWCSLVPLPLETLLGRGCCPKFLDLENYACFLAYKSPEMSASACFGSSHFILMDAILSASAWVILLNASSSLKS